MIMSNTKFDLNYKRFIDLLLVKEEVCNVIEICRFNIQIKMDSNLTFTVETLRV